MESLIEQWWRNEGLTVPDKGTYAYSKMVETYIHWQDDRQKMITSSPGTLSILPPMRRESNRKVMGC